MKKSGRAFYALRSFVSAALLTVSSISSADAATWTNTVVIDLSLATISDDLSGGQLLLGVNTTLVQIPAFAPSVGDTLVTNISFANGGRLKIIDGPNTVDSTPPTFFESLTFYFATTGTEASGNNRTNTTNAAFTNLEGTYLAAGGTLIGDSQGVLAQSLGTLSQDITDSHLSFTGLTLTTTIIALGVGGDPLDRFGLFGGRAGGYEIISGPSAVPLPAALPLFATGLAGLGLLGWRRRRKSGAAPPECDGAMGSKRSGLLAAAFGASVFLCAPSHVYAAPITYFMDLTVSTGSVVGTITTDGTIGVLNGTDIVDYNLTLTNGAHSAVLDTPGAFTTPGALTNRNGLTATTAGLFFDFSSVSSEPSSFFVLEGALGFEGKAGALSLHPSTISLNLSGFGDPNSPIWGSFSGNFEIASAVPLPAALPLFATGLAGLGLLGWRRKRRAAAAAGAA